MLCSVYETYILVVKVGQSPVFIAAHSRSNTTSLNVTRFSPNQINPLCTILFGLSLLFSGLAPNTASAQDLIVENFNDNNGYAESWQAEWTNIAVNTASYGGGTTPTLASRGFASRSSANGPTGSALSSPVSNSDKVTSWVADGNGGFAIRYGDGGITPASNSNTAQRHHNVQINLAKTGNYPAGATSLPTYRYWDNMTATNRRYLRFTAWRDSSPTNNPNPANTAKFVAGMTSPPSSNCAIPDTAIGPWNGSTLEGFTLTTTKQAFILDTANNAVLRADDNWRTNVRIGTLFAPCGTTNQFTSTSVNRSRILNIMFGYWRSGTSAGSTLDPIRFYVDDIVLSERIPGFDTTPSLTLISENGSGTTVGIALAAIPAYPVTLNLASSDAGVLNLSTTTLTFTPADWNVPQIVQVLPVDDSIANGAARTANITFTKGATLDLYYNGASTPAPGNIAITVQDPTPPGIVLTTSTISLDEAAGPSQSTTAALVLSTIPAQPVTFNLSSADTNILTVSPPSLLFDNTNWNIPQIITVTAVDDNQLATGSDRSSFLQFNISTTDPLYSNPLLTPAPEAFTVLNNGLPVSITHMTVE